MGIVSGRCPTEGLRYAKGDEKPPFQTRAEIERQLPGLPAPKANELWEALYLTAPEVDRILSYAKEHAAHPWTFPLLVDFPTDGGRRVSDCVSSQSKNL